MKWTRGKGFVYQPVYIDKRTGERRTASTWWIQYFVRGTRFRESSNSRNRGEAESLLQQRLEAAAEGKQPAPPAQKAKFEDLAKLLLDEYRTSGRRSIGRVEDAIAHLQGFFAGARANEIGSEQIGRYIRRRQVEDGAPATINRELSALRRAFRLAQVAGKTSSRPDISLLPEGNRRDVLFEPHEYRALLDNLPEYLKPMIETAYTTGWRINSEILTLQKRDIDLDSGCLRLEAGETDDKRGRSFPLTRELREVLTRQLKATAEFERRSGQIVPWLFHRKGKPIRDFRKAWSLTCRRASITDKVPDDLRRTAVRNLERAGVSRSVAMAMVGHRSESIYRGIAMDDDTMLKDSAAKLAAFHQSQKAVKH